MASEDSHRYSDDDEDDDDTGAERPLKDGERLLAPTRRPDGTMRKAIRIRAGYTPQDEVAIYQSKGARYRRGLPHVPPGYDPVEDSPQRPKTKSAKKNQKRKEKKHQTEQCPSLASKVEQPPQPALNISLDGGNSGEVDAVVQQMASLDFSYKASDKACGTECGEDGQNLERRIRALRKKIRATESLQSSSTSKGELNLEQSEKLSRLEMFRKELRDLEAQMGSV